MEQRDNMICIVGPTASGKTALSVRLAQALGGEIVSFDSMQVYRRMDIGTAKPTPEERCGVPHHMLDVADPAENYSVSRYVQEGEDNYVVVDDEMAAYLAARRLPERALPALVVLAALLVRAPFALLPDAEQVSDFALLYDSAASLAGGDASELSGEYFLHWRWSSGSVVALGRSGC